MKPSEHLRCLQVGSFEGASALWFAEHLLQHPDSALICLDTWEGGHDFGDQRTPTLSAAMSDVEVCLEKTLRPSWLILVYGPAKWGGI